MPPRSRTSMEYIQQEIPRKMTFRKRKKSIYKKADELSKLCDIDVCLIVYEGNQKNRMLIKPETWPEDPNEFNRILNKYKASKDTPAPGLKRKFELSDFYEAKQKKGVDQNPEKLYPTWDDRINEYSQDDLTKLIGSLEAKIQASKKKIESMGRYKRFAAKQNPNSIRAESSTSNTPQKLFWKPRNHDVQKHGSTSPQMQLMPSCVHNPMLPSAWISRDDPMTTSNGSNH